MADEDNKGSGWWGSTLGKLRSALSKTREAVVDSVIERDPEEQENFAPSAQTEPSTPPPSAPMDAPVFSWDAGKDLEEQVQSYSNLAAVQTATPPAQSVQEPTLVAPQPVQAAPQPIQVAPQPTQVAPQPVQAAPQPTQVAPQPTQAAPQTEPARATAVKTAPPRQAQPIDDDYLEDLEEKLIRADLGLTTVEMMVGDLRKQAKSKGWTTNDVEAFLKKEFSSMLTSAAECKLKLDPAPAVILVVGVNGTGKTTSIGKLCYRLRQQGKKVLMAAGDTFRAAAETQLEIWAERAQVDIVRLPDGSDPGAVVFQAIKKAREEKYDVTVIDTAGRLHNKTNLMAELRKVRTVVDKNAGDFRIESLLVLDASTGQNGLQQAKLFTEVASLTGVILTKLDGSAKGGVIFSIANELKIPVKLIGLGEKIEDLRDFEPELFIEALF
jgi:signal recognition particle-docking protein FtsY